MVLTEATTPDTQAPAVYTDVLSNSKTGSYSSSSSSSAGGISKEVLDEEGAALWNLDVSICITSCVAGIEGGWSAGCPQDLPLLPQVFSYCQGSSTSYWLNYTDVWYLPLVPAVLVCGTSLWLSDTKRVCVRTSN